MSSTGEFSYIKVSKAKRAIVDDHENVATFGTKGIVKQYTVDDFIHFNEQIEKRHIPKYDGNPNTFGDPDPAAKSNHTQFLFIVYPISIKPSILTNQCSRPSISLLITIVFEMRIYIMSITVFNKHSIIDNDHEKKYTAL